MDQAGVDVSKFKAGQSFAAEIPVILKWIADKAQLRIGEVAKAEVIHA
jgi:hypothetical protein